MTYQHAVDRNRGRDVTNHRRTHYRRKRVPVSLISALLVAAAGVHLPSSAQDYMGTLLPAQSTGRAIGPRPGVQRDVIIGFYPSVDIGLTNTDNALRTPDNEQSDTNLDLGASLYYKNDLGTRHQFDVGYTGRITRYDEFDNRDSSNHQVEGAVLLDLSKIVDLDLFARLLKGTEDRGSSGSRLQQPLADGDKFDRSSLGGILTFGRRSNAVQFELGAGASEIDYTNNDQGDRDRDDSDLGARLYYNFSPITSIYLSGRERQIDYQDRTLDRDSDETTLELGVRWEPTFLTTLDVAYGNLDKEFDNPTLQGYDSDTYRARLDWRPRDATKVGFYASKRTEESPEVPSSFFVSKLVGINLTQTIAGRFDLRAYLNDTKDDYTSGRNDDITDIGLGLDYGLNSWLSIGGLFANIERDSSPDLASYDENRFTLLLRGNWVPGSR